jgi:hypothetical protein
MSAHFLVSVILKVLEECFGVKLRAGKDGAVDAIDFLAADSTQIDASKVIIV